MTPSEKSIFFLKQIGLDHLSTVALVIKNQNPYENNTIQYVLWEEFAGKNIPFLIMLSNYIQTLHQNQQFHQILFSTRDCVFLRPLFNKLYPEISSDIFYTSRALCLFPPDEYIEYCKKNLNPNSLVVDFQGTGQSFMALISRLKLDPWYLLVNWNSHNRANYSKIYLDNYNKKFVIRNKNYFDDSIEKLNVDLVGTYFDFYDEKAIPYKYEYNASYISSLHNCFKLFMQFGQALNYLNHLAWI